MARVGQSFGEAVRFELVLRVSKVCVKRFGGIASAAITASFMASAAAAATITTVDYQGPGGVFGDPNLSETVTITSPFLIGGGADDSQSVNAGPFRLSGDNGIGDFIAFCVDLTRYMGDGKIYEFGVNLFGAAIVNNLDKLFSSVYAEVDTTQEGAAFQVAIWEIVYDSAAGFDLGDGDFEASNNIDVINLADTYLAGLGGAATGVYDLTFLSTASGYANNNSQSLVTAIPAPVPLPAAGLMLGAGLAGLGALRRLRKS